MVFDSEYIKFQIESDFKLVLSDDVFESVTFKTTKEITACDARTNDILIVDEADLVV